jgi:hypothetical protein
VWVPMGGLAEAMEPVIYKSTFYETARSEDLFCILRGVDGASGVDPSFSSRPSLAITQAVIREGT